MRTKFLFLFVLALGATALFTSCRQGERAAYGKFFCPMHPTYVSDRPGDCPICHMKLVPVKGDQKDAMAAHMNATNQAAPGVKYRCPNHPEYLYEQPGLCPIDEVKLEPVHDTNAVAAAELDHARHEKESEAAAVPGRVAVQLSPDKQQLIGLRTVKVEPRTLAPRVRTAGTLEHDESKLARIAPRFGGWVRKLHVNYTGQHVEKGEPLLTVYSPELFSAGTEYLLALRHLESLGNGSAAARDSARQLLESARRRLELWEVGEGEIRELEQSGQARDEVLLRAPVSGHVVAKTAVEGRAFMAGETLYEIADLSSIWVRAFVSERDLPLVKDGAKAVVRFPQIRHSPVETTIDFIYPHIDPQTRRAEVRLVLPNPEHRLRPDMWAQVEIAAEHGTVLSVPASAIIDTGERFVAFVRHDSGHLEPREVKVGTRTEDFYEVRGGLSAGEQVVTRALFLIDSESQLKAAISGMGAAGGHEH